MKKFMMTAIFMMALTTLAFGQTMTKAEMEVLKINKEYDTAVVRLDVAALERILADDYMYTDTDGSISDKRLEIQAAKSGDLTFESGISDDLKVRVYGNTATVTGRWTSKGKYKNWAFDEKDRYTTFYVKRGGRWQLVSEIAVRIIEENDPKMLKENLMKLEQMAWEAWKNKEAKYFESYLTDNAVGIAPMGMWKKVDVVKEIAGTNCTLKSYALDNFEVMMVNDTTALLTYRAEQDFNCGGKQDAPTVLASSLFVKRGDRWLGVFHQETPSQK
jgi:hypothetical protein